MEQAIALNQAIQILDNTLYKLVSNRALYHVVFEAKRHLETQMAEELKK